MVANISVTFKNIDNLSAKMTNFKTALFGELNSAVKDISKSADQAIKEEAPDATGELKESITTDISSSADRIVSTISPGADYAYYVEHGRGAGGPPPIDKITTWLNAKGLDPAAAFMVARKIGRTGVQANPFVKRAFDKIKSGINSRVLSAVVLTTRRIFK